MLCNSSDSGKATHESLLCLQVSKFWDSAKPKCCFVKSWPAILLTRGRSLVRVCCANRLGRLGVIVNGGRGGGESSAKLNNIAKSWPSDTLKVVRPLIRVYCTDMLASLRASAKQ